MKRSGKNFLLLIAILILAAIYAGIRSGDTESVDLYLLNGNYYLHKGDYFSEYSVAQKTDGDFVPVAENVDALSATGPPYYLRIDGGGGIRYLSLAHEKPDTIPGRTSLIENMVWQKPWQYVETRTLHDPRKLAGQIVLITIIALVFLLVMRVFRIRRLTRRDLMLGL